MIDTPASGGHPWLHRLGLYVRLVRLHKPIGILLLVWPTLWALWQWRGSRIRALAPGWRHDIGGDSTRAEASAEGTGEESA